MRGGTKYDEAGAVALSCSNEVGRVVEYGDEVIAVCWLLCFSPYGLRYVTALRACGCNWLAEGPCGDSSWSEAPRLTEDRF